MRTNEGSSKAQEDARYDLITRATRAFLDTLPLPLGIFFSISMLRTNCYSVNIPFACKGE